jgi:hypothetical protein
MPVTIGELDVDAAAPRAAERPDGAAPTGAPSPVAADPRRDHEIALAIARARVRALRLHAD